jgi:hypothetical protein
MKIEHEHSRENIEIFSHWRRSITLDAGRSLDSPVHVHRPTSHARTGAGLSKLETSTDQPTAFAAETTL